MHGINPIETEYNGYKFRSRLEARWAVFFDSLNLDYEYEPEGFELVNGTRYLPDFVVHGVNTRACQCDCPIDLYVEVKGTGRYSKEDSDKVLNFPYPIMVVGDIPDPDNYIKSCEEQTDKYCKKYVKEYGCAFCPWQYNTIDSDTCFRFSIDYEDGKLCFHGADNSYCYGTYSKEIENALREARQARFEHGETPLYERSYK